MSALARGLAALRTELSETWKNTVVLVVTEFGRTVSINGTRGSDHGTGGMAFALGGSVAGGRVHADWPGLATGQLFEGRDLRITTDIRSIFKGVLRDHLALDPTSIDRDIFPESTSARALDGLMRA